MEFISFAYMMFVLIAAILYYVLPKVTRPVWLLACSLVFYLYDAKNAGFIVVLLGVTLVTYVCGLLLEAMRNSAKAVRIATMAITLATCFGTLIYYKYSTFLFGTTFSVAVPLGISYFIFSSTGYLVDVYRGKTKAEKNPIYYALFVTFFPNIVAGPIERANNMIKQFKKPVAFDYSTVSGGIFRILWGLFKKIVLANALLGIVNPVFSNMESYSGPMLIIAALLFSYQLYMDFSALSDIAIGTGAVFGLTIMENFKRPLASASISDLWRRWHISLSSWFRDYLYFPLGGSKKGRVRAHINTIIVFVVSGLWHGASVGYIIWGALNGLFLVVGKETLPLREKLHSRNPLYALKPVKTVIQACFTYILFSAAFVFFCAELYSKDAGCWLAGMYFFQNMFADFGTLFDGTVQGYLAALGFEGVKMWIIIGGIIMVEGFEYLHEPTNILIRKMPFFLRLPMYYALILAIYFFGEFGVSGFVYQAY